MHALYLALITIGTAYLLFKHRRFDYFSILYFTGIFYCLHAIPGYVESAKSYGYFYIEVSPYSYACLIVFFSIIFAGLILFDHHHPSSKRPPMVMLRHSGRYVWYALSANCLTSVLLLFATWSAPEIILHSGNKGEVLENLGRLHSLFQLSAVFGVAYSFLSKYRLLMLWSAACVLVDVYIGFRLTFVLSALAVMVIMADRAPTAAPLYLRWRMIVGGAMLGSSALTIKRIYKGFKTGDEELLQAGWSKVLETPLETVLNAEPQATMLMFLSSVDARLRVGFDYVLHQFVGLVPFAPELNLHAKEGFNDLVQEPILYVSEESTGLAASSLGEWHAIGGLGGVAVYATLLVAFVWTLSLQRTKSATFYMPCHILVTLIVFYNYRNGISQLLNFSRNAILMWLVLGMVAWVVEDVLGRMPRRGQIQ